MMGRGRLMALQSGEAEITGLKSGIRRGGLASPSPKSRIHHPAACLACFPGGRRSG